MFGLSRAVPPSAVGFKNFGSTGGGMYRPKRDWARVCGVACEDADQAAAVGVALDPLTPVVLDPDTARSVRVDHRLEPRLPALRRWASAAKEEARPSAVREI